MLHYLVLHLVKEKIVEPITKVKNNLVVLINQIQSIAESSSTKLACIIQELKESKESNIVDHNYFNYDLSFDVELDFEVVALIADNFKSFQDQSDISK